MNNGIGLETPRGSGTSGYVQRNVAHLSVSQQEKPKYNTEEDFKRIEAQLNRPPNQELLAHTRKRQLELKVVELRDLMEEQGYPDADIDKKAEEYRQLLSQQLNESADPACKMTDSCSRPLVTDTHQLAGLKIEKNQMLRDAFGISADFVDGTSMEKMKQKADAPKEWLTRFQDEQRARQEKAAEEVDENEGLTRLQKEQKLLQRRRDERARLDEQFANEIEPPPDENDSPVPHHSLPF